MKRHVTFKSMAEALVFGGWGSTEESPSQAIKDHPDTRLMLSLLIDIAESLRVLRCGDFKRIPAQLQQIRRNTNSKKKKR